MRSARHSAASSAAEDERPAPSGSVLSIVSSAGLSAYPAARSSATAPSFRERKAVRLAASGRVHHDALVGAQNGRDRHAVADREREAEAVVVVRVLADQVRAARAECDGAQPHVLGVSAYPARPR